MEPGFRLGPYEITAKLGAGGMGEVWRATDSRLKREVALKVLPAAFTDDKERLARFEREAQLLAQLHHPHIASIFGLEEGDRTTGSGVRALVMELVDGQDLSSIMARGPVPVHEALGIARQIAEALEAAHERGIVHRDLKPANVKVQADSLSGAGGTVKVLDFGLAKAMDSVDAAGSATDLARSPTLMHSPTLTRLHGTELGVILGTAAYMSPEQARGGAVDKRADIWAFGVVLWEMLTGRRLFGGATVSDTLAAVLRDTVALDALPPSTPDSVRRLIERCLERNPRQRLRDIGEARVALEGASDEAPPDVAPAAMALPRWTAVLPWVVAFAALGLAGALWWKVARGAARQETSSAVVRLELSLPPGVEPVTGLAAGLAVAPDGHAIALIGFRAGQRRLYVRRFDDMQSTEVEASSGANAVTFSPDSASIVFVRGSSEVVRLSLVDQQRVALASGADLRNSVAWGESGTIYYQRAGEIWQVAAAGGTSTRLTRLDAARHEVLHSDAIELAGAHRLLFASLTGDPDGSRIESVSLDGGTRSVLVEHATSPVLSPTDHLLFERGGGVWAIALDRDRAAVSGQAALVLPSSSFAAPRYGTLAYRLARSGTLAYMPHDFEDRRVMAVARDGTERSFDIPQAPLTTPRVSGDGRRLLLENGSAALETLDFARGTRTQLVGATFGTSFASWTRDDRRVILRRFTTPLWVATDGSGSTGAFPAGTINDYPAAPGPDNDSMLMGRILPETAGDVYLMSISGSFPPKPLLATPAYEGAAQLSPDGRWILYQSNTSGQPEAYVRRYPELDRAWQVSEGGGGQPRWSRDGREVFYRNGVSMMAASFDGQGAGEPRLGRPQTLFADDYDFGPGISNPNYDVLPDGRFILLRRAASSGHIEIVLHWDQELSRLLANGGLK